MDARSLMGTHLDKLGRFATQRLGQAKGSELGKHLRSRFDERAFSLPMVPEEMSLGYRTEFWDRFDEEAQLALNHWIYDLKYYRICDGEVFVRASNQAIAHYLKRRGHHDLAALLFLENEEERDHIDTFERVREALHKFWDVPKPKMPVKPARVLMISSASLNTAVRLLGEDFVVTYFLARGIVNHMGKGFEVALMKARELHPFVSALSKLHTTDENKHMALSSFMAAAAYELLERRRNHPGYRRLLSAFQRFTLKYTLSEQTTKDQEIRMSKAVLPKMRGLKSVDLKLLDRMIHAHFSQTSGLEAAKNAYMPRFNQRLLERSCLELSEKQSWLSAITKHQGMLTFFPKDFCLDGS